MSTGTFFIFFSSYLLVIGFILFVYGFIQLSKLSVGVDWVCSTLLFCRWKSLGDVLSSNLAGTVARYCFYEMRLQELSLLDRGLGL